MRGWGALQRLPDAEKIQDANLQFMVDALNEKASGEVDALRRRVAELEEGIARLTRHIDAETYPLDQHREVVRQVAERQREACAKYAEPSDAEARAVILDTPLVTEEP